jgi:hypothetical protein
MRCARVIASAHRPRRPPGRVNHKGRVRAVVYGSTGAGNSWQLPRTKQKRREEGQTAINGGYGFLPPSPNGGGSLC